MSNDAFFCLYKQEDPVSGPEAWDEAFSVLSKIPSGYTLVAWNPLSSGLIEAIFEPKEPPEVPLPEWAQGKINITKDYGFIFRIEGPEARVALWHRTKGLVQERGVFPITFIGNTPWVECGKCKIPLISK